MKTVIRTSIVGPFLRPYFILTAIALEFLALSPGMRAVTPPPDGGYPGNNTAEGSNALLGLTSGTFNTAIGMSSLQSDTIGSFNTAIGAFALLSNTASENTATGAGALLSNTTGGSNTANGALALESNTTGSFNTANGAFALLNNTASRNTATGFEALESNTTGSDNTASGAGALLFNRSGEYNCAFGSGALASNVSAGDNTAIGYQTLFSNSSEGILNTAVGFQALFSNNGFIALQNTAVGATALYSNTGTNNTALGFGAGFNQTTGSNNVYIGAGINGVAGESNACRIASIFGQTVANGSAVFVTSGNKLGMTTSSKRFKEDIKSMDKASEAVFALKPVSFRYKKEVDPTRTAQFGLVAEDVEKVNPDLIVRDSAGKPYSVRYDQVNAMLLNEFLKEHKTVLELKTEIAELTATVKEQAAQIQKVSARLEVSERRSRTVLNDP